MSNLAKNLAEINLDPTALNIDDEDVDYNYEDEDFTWYDDKTMRDETYFVLVNCERKTIKKGE